MTSVSGEAPQQPRFLVDQNAARLVRWLRLMGYDTLYLPHAGDAALVERARDEARVLLTRDRGIMVRRPIARGEAQAVLLDSDDTWQQLRQVVRDVGLDPRAAPFSRCPACNAVLQPVTCEEAQPHVPPFVAATQQHFTRCPDCGRHYWRGTHWQRVNTRLGSLGDEPGL